MPNPEIPPSSPEPQPGEAPKQEECQRILRNLAGQALILTELDKVDVDNAVNEATEAKVGRNFLARIPIVNLVTRPLVTAYYRVRATDEVLANTRNLSGDNNESREYAERRARLALKAEAGAENMILNQGETVKGINNTGVVDAITNYYESLKRIGSSKKPSELKKDDAIKAQERYEKDIIALQNLGELNQDGGKKTILESGLVRFLIGNQSKRGINDLSPLFGLEESVQALVKHNISEKDFREYLKNNLTLYSASMKQGVYTKEKVDNVTAAVAAFGAIGGLTYSVLNRSGRSSARSGVNQVVGSLTSNAAVAPIAGGAAVGFAMGAIRGAGRARVNASKSEIRAATSAEAINENSGTNGERGEASSSSSTAESRDGSSAKAKRLIGALSKFGRKSREEEYFEKVEALRNRKSASYYYSRLDEILKGNTDDTIKAKEASEVLAEIIARNRVSQEMGIDLISYSAGHISKERFLLANKMQEVQDLLKITNTEANQRMADKWANELRDDNKQANSLLRKFTARQAMVDGVVGALAGGTAGAAIFAYRNLIVPNKDVLMERARETASKTGERIQEVASKTGKDIQETASKAGAKINSYLFGTAYAEESELGGGPATIQFNEAGGDAAVLEADSATHAAINVFHDGDGDYLVQAGNVQLFDSGEDVYYNDDGSLKEDFVGFLKEQGIHVNVERTDIPIPGATKTVSVEEFFSPENQEANHLVTYLDQDGSRTWHNNSSGNALYGLRSGYGDDDTIYVDIEPNSGADQNYDNMKILFSPRSIMGVGIALDVDDNTVEQLSDGTVRVRIPTDSPAASFFQSGQLVRGRVELVELREDGKLDVYSTLGNGEPVTGYVTVPNPEATLTEYQYTLTDGNNNPLTDKNGNPVIIKAPNSITGANEMKAELGIESQLGLGEPSVYTDTSESTSLSVNGTGEIVQVDHVHHHGGYSDINDTYFSSAKDGNFNSGISVVREMMGEEGAGLSARQIDKLFLEKIETGQISEGEVVKRYLEIMGDSPESLVTTRAMLGGFYAELNGTTELIDTQAEINDMADIVSRMSPEDYDAFVDGTFEEFYKKISGGTIRFIDYDQEHYQFTSWATLGSDNNVIQHLANAIDPNTTNGVGIVFVDKDGNSIYDKAIARKIWNLPESYNLEYISDRLNCLQKTARGIFGSVQDTVSPNPNPTPVPNPTPTPTTTPIAPKDSENLERIDEQIQRDISQGIGSSEVVLDRTEQVNVADLTPQAVLESYDGTNASIVENAAAGSAIDVSSLAEEQFNGYANNIGGLSSSSSGAFSTMVTDNAQAQAQADAAAISTAAVSDGTPIEEILGELGIY